MSAARTIGDEVLLQSSRLQELLKHTMLVGGVYSMGYSECLVLTNDLWKKQAGGVPQHCLLLATTFNPGERPASGEEEVLLLRVVSGAPLPAENELVQVRAEAIRDIVTNEGREAAADGRRIVDVLTRNEIQFSGLKAKVLGTFTHETVDGQTILHFASDLKNYHSSTRYRVFKPYGSSLETIASYPEITPTEARRQAAEGTKPRRIRLGVVRYSSATHSIADVDPSQSTSVPVRVNVEDFIALKTAVFGMTRLGKSNTMKTLATAIFEHSVVTGRKIGQLLFDPSAEYASVNVQDKTALSQLGPEHVSIFRYGQQGTKDGVHPLCVNFFDRSHLDVAWSILRSALGTRDATYLKGFLSVDLVGPTEVDKSNFGDSLRAERRRAAFYACLVRAGYQAPGGFSVSFCANKEVVQAVNGLLKDDPIESDDKGRIRCNKDQLLRWWDALLALHIGKKLPADWVDSDLEAILVVLGTKAGSGWRVLVPHRVYHSPHSDKDYAELILQELAQGKIVIVDLSQGSGLVVQFSSERIVREILQDAMERFAAGKEPLAIQIYLEEAHQLLSRDRVKDFGEADPYVRLAKEAAKFKIGLIYATQEVTSVDPIILSNTSNWVVTHLNNEAQVRELAGYYDFADYREQIIRAQDPGFVRLKTRSSPFILPVQVDLFTDERVKAAAQLAAERSGAASDAISS